MATFGTFQGTESRINPLVYFNYFKCLLID